MTTQFGTIGLLMLFSSMLPGPDFALVVKNTILKSKMAGFATSLGVGCAILVHISYCVLGLALVIAHSPWLFNLIKYLGSSYLLLLGVKMCLSKAEFDYEGGEKKQGTPSMLLSSAFTQGFLCNLLNPKASLFFLAIFTVIVKPGTSYVLEGLYALEMFLIITGWFFALTLMLSHKHVLYFLQKLGPYLSRILGVFLLGFALMLLFIKL